VTPACRLCGSPLQRTFVDLGMSPLCESYVTADRLDAMEPFYPLHVRVCERCLLVQLPELVSREELFNEYAYFSSFSTTWVQHAGDYVSLVTERFALDTHSFVIEVASNDGYLLQHFRAKEIPVLGIEPAANVARAAQGKGIPTLVEFFGVSTADRLAAEGRSCDLVVANNVLAQVPDLHDFVEGLRRIVRPQGVITLEFPHLVRLIEGRQFDTIYHEHFSYFSLLTAERLFSAHALRIFDVEEIPTHGGSLRVYVGREEDSTKPVTDRVKKVETHERNGAFDRLAGYDTFAKGVAQVRRSLLAFLFRAKDENRTVAGYGAPGKGNTLLNYCGIRADLLPYTVDRNPYKQGKYLPGTRIPIMHPDRIPADRPDYVLILPWNIKDEIIGQLSPIREWGGRFVVPIPDVEVC
jgi:SAM-dependent methyltransferase